ncbi:hypothetical protein D3C71_290570 [compost metagenome]
MKLNLNGSKKPAASPSADTPSAGGRAAPRSSAPARAASAPPRPKGPETYGRSCEPPPPGSSYWEFLHWASEGGMPLPEDTDIAISLWAGAPPASEEESSVPGMR